ncbi:MAG TPA: DUF4190 domain-containing protein [Anaerolineaceae bacterium]|jgi:hypothetical protein|nr:DUF4190 domain-containing protein [Anaerolineaceae bacterium]
MNNSYDVNQAPQEQFQHEAPQPAPQPAPPPYQPAPPPYQPTPQAQAAAPGAKTSYWAIISLITGILNFKFPPFGAIAALVTGYVARKEIRESNGTISGDGFATAGLVLGWIGIVFSIIALVLAVLLIVGLFTSMPTIFEGMFNWLGL